MKNIYLSSTDICCRTLIDVLENRGRLQGKKIAYQFLNESVKDSEPSFQAISFEETCIVAKNIAKVLQEKKIQNGDRVLLIYPPGIDLITAYYGCLYAGAVAILVYPPLNSRLVEKLQLIVQDAKPSLILTTCEIKKKIKKLRLLKKTSSLPVLGKLIHNSFEKYVTLGAWDEFLPMLTTDNIKIDPAIKLPPSNINSASLAFLQYSSGSTAHPKGVMVSHGNLIHNLDLMSRIGKMTDNDIGVSWLPPYHDMGLIGAILIPFFVGYTAILMSPLKFLRNPFQWLKIISDFKVTITVAPNFSFEYCVRKITPEQKKKLDLSSLRVLFNGAEPIHAKTLEHFYQAFKHTGFKKEAFHPCYGLAEATLFVSGAANTRTVKVAMAALEEHKFILSDKNKNVKTLVSCGSCFQSVKIVNPKTKYLSQDNEIGEIWVHSDSVTKGYWGKQLLTQKTFQAHIKGDDAKLNYLRTGDLGFIYENELYVTGRLKDVIIIRGRNLYPQDIELLVESSHDKIRLGGCAVFAIEKNDDENLTIVCEVDASASEHDWSGMVNSICRNIAGEYGISVASIVFINAKTLLKTTSGKVRRQPTKDAFLNNMLDTRHHWRTPTFSSDNQENNLVEEDALKWATDWIKNHTHKEINPKLTFIEQGLDSIAIVEFSQALGDQYDLEIDPLIAWEHPNIDAFVKHVVKNQQSLNRDQIVPLKNELLPKSLSSGQLRLYYLHMMHPDSHAYNIAGAFRLQGNLSIEKFQATLQTMLDRHDVLRTVIKNAQPIILAKLMAYLPIHNLMSEPVAQRKNKIKRLLKAASNKQYDLSEGPLIRFLLIQLATDDYIFLTTTHHIIFDGTSMFVFFKELLQIYEAQVENRPLSLSAMPLQFYDFANWQQEHFTGTIKKELLKFWTNYLADVPTELRIPYDNVKSEINSEPVIHRLHFNLPQTVSSEIEKYCGQHSITPFVFLLTAYQLLLAKYTNQNDFVIGVPTSGRTKAQAQQLIGFFVNTLPVRATADKKISIRKLLETNNKMLNTVYKHQDIPLPELISALSIERDVDGQILIQTMFVMQNEFQFNLSTPNLDVTPYWSESGQLDYNLTMEVIPFNDQYRVVFSFNNLLLESATIKQMAKHFRNLIKSMLHKTDAMIGKLSPLDKYEFHQIVHYWNATDAQPPDARTLSKMFEQQVKTTPHSPALMFDDQTLTYDELNRKANQYANYLVSRGVQANNIVGIHLQRSVEMITCLLAILKAQGAYLALDIQYPEIRLNDLIEDSECKLIIGDSVHNLPAAQHYRVLTLNELQDNSKNLSDENLGFLSEQAQDTLAYVIYTSGSTGKPKGVLIEHKNICQRLANISQTSMSVDQVLHITNFTFDVSVMSLWHPLTKGGTCLVACENDMRTWDIKSLQKLIHDYRITSFFATPTQLSTLLIAANEQDFATVVDVFIAGEALKLDLVNRTKQKIKNAKIWNAYGPTECTVISSIFLANDWKKANIPIGSPLTNDKYYVLNDDLSPVPIGVIGELYIGGEGVARGYLNRTDLTETKFIPNPFIEDYQTKMYKTGDLVKWLPEGIIEYSGRIDNQVKIRGMRVELGEIEAKLIEHPQIKEAVVVVDQHSSVARIIAYLILESNPSITVADIKNYLASLLPTHMLPSNYAILDSFPMNTNGKIDYRALPVVDFKTQVATKDMRELNEVEEKLLGVFKKVLQNDNVDIYDNFFEVGGDSILSIHLTMLANEQNLNFTVQDLIKYPTIKELASTMGISTVNVAKQPRQTTGEVPLTPIQHWFMEQSLAVPHAWAQGIALSIKPNIDLAGLKSVFETVIAKHPVLNMRFKKVNGEIKQFYSKGTQTNSVDFENASLSENSLNELVDKLTASLNIYDGPLYKIAVVHDSSQDLTKMIMVVHHLVIDGISWRILLNEITFLLESSVSELPLETNTFKDWGLKLLEYARSDALLQEKDYWLAIKSPNKPIANEKAQNIDDKPRAKIEINLSKGQTQNLLYTRTKDSKNIQTEAILLTMLLQAYQKWTGEPELLLHLETHGRENLFNDVDINRTVGWFTSFYPALLKLPEDNLDVIETINHVNNQVQSVPNKGFGYGILRYLVQDKIIKQQLASQDNAAIIFNYLGQINGQESDFFLMEEEPFSVQSDQNKSHHPIEINAYIFNGSLRLAFNYDRRYLEDDQIKLFVEGYRQFLMSFIHHKAKTKELGIVTQLNKEQQREAIFCIHPIAGSVLSYAKLANLLEGKYTVYGIQASGLEGESLPSHSVEEMAIHYIRKVKTIQDKGPYKLMGWSMGGLIAYEMAVQLKAMGERVSFVNLIDVEDPLTMPKPESMNEKLFFYYLTTLIEDTLGDRQIKVMSWKFKLFLFLLKYNGSSHLVALLISYMMRINEGVDPGHFKKYIGMLKHDLTTTKKTQFPIKKLVTYMKQHHLLSGAINADQFVNFYEVYRANFYAVQHYLPKAYREKIVSFSAIDSTNIRRFNSVDNDIENIDVPGNHFDVLRNLESLNIISKRLESESKAA